jgi:succinate-semialdehyde dehydrogenase/glutarate-semialdehyde dehydrogenase
MHLATEENMGITGKSESLFAKHGCELANSTLLDCRGLVNGRWKSAKTQKTFPVYEPSSGEILQECADLDRDDFLEAIDCAYEGYQEFFSSTTAQARGVMLRKWNDLILANADDCMRLGHLLVRMT